MHTIISKLSIGHMLSINFDPATGLEKPGLIAWNDPANPGQWHARPTNRAGNVMFPAAEHVRNIVDAGDLILLVTPDSIIAMQQTSPESLFPFMFRNLSAPGLIRVERPSASPAAAPDDEEDDEPDEPIAGVMQSQARTIADLEASANAFEAENMAMKGMLASQADETMRLETLLDDLRSVVLPFQQFARELLAGPKAEHMANSIPLVSAGIRHLTWGHFRRLVAEANP